VRTVCAITGKDVDSHQARPAEPRRRSRLPAAPYCYRVITQRDGRETSINGHTIGVARADECVIVDRVMRRHPGMRGSQYCNGRLTDPMDGIGCY
jgi:hypothetical protein